MSSITDQTIVPLTKYLNNFSRLLKKAEAFADEKGIPHEEMLTHRLIADQKDITFQVQCCCNTIKNLLVRFGAMEKISIPDEEKTFAELHARIESTLEMLNQADKAALDADMNKRVLFESSGPTFVFKTRQTYLSEFLIPYFHFHLVTGYCILRNKGVDVGSMDFLNGVMVKLEE